MSSSPTGQFVRTFRSCNLRWPDAQRARPPQRRSPSPTWPPCSSCRGRKSARHISKSSSRQPVTAIEVLSPSNKQPGAGRTSYEEKREELIAARVNFVEIDLLHEGDPVVRLSREKLAALGRFHYLVAVTRQYPSRQEVDAVPVDRRLPRVAIPLDADVPSVTLDVQAAFTRCWNEGPYPELLRYHELPPGRWPEDESAWIVQAVGEHRSIGPAKA